MKKVLFLFFIWIYPIVSFSAITECLTDVYFGNGILTDEGNATANTILLKRRIQKDIYNLDLEEYKKSIGKVREAYNSTHGWGIGDLIESLLQKLSIATLVDMASVVSDMSKIYTKLTKNSHAADLSLQVNKYKGSIENGRKVLVVAHSQGNLFAYEAYRKLPLWMQNYWESVGVASPGMFEIKGGAPSIAWDNDLVADLALNPFRSRKYCEVRRVYWDPQRGAVGLTLREKKPNSNYVYDTQLDKIYKEDWKAVEGIFEKFDFRVHSFRFYMGEELAEGAIKNAFNGEALVTNTARIEILSAIETKLNNEKNCPCSGASSKPSITTKNGAIETTLSWSNACNINMDLSFIGDRVIQDLKDVENVGLEHAYVASQSDIYPGAVYKASATGEKRLESNLEERYLEDNPVSIYAVVKTPGGSKFKQYEARNFGQLNLGEFAVIEVKDKKIETTYTTGGSSGSSGGGGGGGSSPYVRTYDECDDADKKYSCVCVPCEFIVYGMENAVQYGPIGDADVEIIRADTYGSLSPSVVYRGRTTNDSDLFKSGLIKFDQSDYEKFEDDIYYVVDAKGGSDLDRDDDLIKDATPTTNNGTIHAIIKGSDLKTVAFRVNALTEAIYQVSGNLLGTGYDVIELEEKLALASKKLFREKTFIFNNELEINYHDVLLWTPGVDKKKLFKPYDTFVEPIVVKTYADQDRVKESYRLIYEKLDSDAPQLTPLALEIPHTIPNNSIIGKVNIASEGVSGIERIELHGDANVTFSINKEGLVKVVDRDALILDAVYKLDMIAIGIDGKRGISMELIIKVIEGTPLADPSATVPMLESIEVVDLLENSPDGTFAAQVHFTDSSLNIVGYNLSGEYNSFFTIDNAGSITVAPHADIDYEKSDTYTIKVSAINDAGNESFPVAFSIKIINEIDTPLHDLVYLTYLTENVPLGTIVGEIVQLREGRSPITSFDILNPNVPFAIDINGTIRTTGYINYEKTIEYNLIAIARTDSGNSNKVDVQIIIHDVSPETGRPSIQEFTANIDENINVRAYVGTLNINKGASPVELIELRGTGSSNFTVDVNGTITIASDATLDYEQKSNYSLQAIAHNANGSSDLVAVDIALNNVEDEAPSLFAFTKHIDENATSGTIVGTVSLKNSGEGNITGFTLSGTGSEDFVIDENGTIRISMSTILDYETIPAYQLQATAFSDVGESEPVSVRIYILNIAEHVPVLKPFAVSVDEIATEGTVIGTIEEAAGGDSPITSYALSDTTIFSIDNNGILRLGALLDYSMQSYYGLEVNATNDAGTSDPVTVNITVLRYFYTGNSSDDRFTGSSRDEKFDTKEGDDFVDAGAGDDTITGGIGNDILNGGYGDDIYIYSLGDGNDTIEDRKGDDRLLLHNIERESLSFGLTENDLVIHIGEDNSTIVIQNWKNDSYKIENIIFDDDTEISLEDFNLPLVKPDAGIVDLSKLGNINAQQVVEGRIVPIASGYNSVDHWIFNYSGGILEIDLLSELASNGQTYIDIDRDGEQTGVDVYIYLFNRDQNGNWEYVAENDDSSSGGLDGSSHRYDSYLNINLQEGEYMLAVSNYNLSSSTALGDRNSAQNYPDGGPYQISFNAILEFSQFPENANNDLYGRDHYNFYVLRNDMDPYNIDGLGIIADLRIVDENGTSSDMLGTVQTEGRYISYYPETYFEDLDRSVEVNVFYDVVNQNGISARSILTLHIIPSLYTHIEPTVNQILWEEIKSENSMSELNITKE